MPRAETEGSDRSIVGVRRGQEGRAGGESGSEELGRVYPDSKGLDLKTQSGRNSLLEWETTTTHVVPSSRARAEQPLLSTSEASYKGSVTGEEVGHSPKISCVCMHNRSYRACLTLWQ